MLAVRVRNSGRRRDEHDNGHPERIAALFPDVQLDAILADVNDDRSVAPAVAGVEGVVNAVSLCAESGHGPSIPFTSRPQHGSPGLREKWASGGSSTCPALAPMPDPPRRISAVAGEEKKLLARLFPVRRSSALRHGRARRRVIPIARMLRRLPVFPLFGRGQTQLQPAYVEDVADAIASVMQNTQSPMCYELGGPRVYAYRSLLEVIARHLGIKPLLISIPFGLWHALASVAEMLDKGRLAGSIPSDLARVLSPPTSPLSEPRPRSTHFESPLFSRVHWVEPDRRRDHLSDVDGR
jgi:hypothetical protein